MTAHSSVRRVLTARPHEVLALLADRSLAERRALCDPGLPGIVVALTSADGAVGLTIRAGLPLGWVPPSARGRLRGNAAVVRRESWRVAGNGAVADIDVLLDGVPATSAHVAGSLTPCGRGSELSYDLSLTVAAPLLGGSLEKAMLGRIVRAYEKECDVIANACP